MNDVTSKKLNDLRTLATLLDSQFTGPFGIKFGLDALIGLFPVFGDLVTSGLSLYIIVQAAMLGCGPATLLRMGLNVAIENIVDIIPFLGHLFDFLWKSNNKNIAILEQHLLHPCKVLLTSRLIILGMMMFLLSLVVASGVATIYTINYLVHLF